MRKTVLALFLALAACMACSYQATAMDGFDLGDMPPLPPPLLDDASTSPLTPPGSGLDSPLNQVGDMLGGMPSPLDPAPAMTPVPPPPAFSSPPGPGSGSVYTPATETYSPPAGDFSGTPLPPPPPLAPPPVDDGLMPGQIGGSSLQPPQTAGGTTSPLAPSPLASQPPDSQAVVGLEENEVPRSGQITGGRVNVRAGPNTQYESIAVLATGTPLTVLAQNGEWLKIMYPAEQLASIHKKYVTAEIPAEIPEEGVAGVVNQDNTDVHAFYWDKSTVVGKLNKGAPVIIKQERGQWYRIVAPLNARAYVFAKYVKLDADAPIVADKAPLPVNPSVDVSAVGADGKPMVKTKLSAEEEKVREIKEARAKQSLAQLDKIKEKEEILRKQEEERIREMERRQKEAEEMVKARAQADLQARMLQANQLEAALRDLDSRLTAIDGEKVRQAQVMGRRFGQQINPTTVVGSAAGWAPPDPPGGGFVGWVENIGRVGGAPSPFRLTKGGEIRFWLVSEKHDLDKFTNLRVLCDGDVVHAGGTTASILRVNNIRLLTEWEIAGGPPPGAMTGPGRPAPQVRPGMPGQPGWPQQPGPGFRPQQREEPYADPYANAVDVTDYTQPGFDVPPPAPARQGSALDSDPLAGSTYGAGAPINQGYGYGAPGSGYGMTPGSPAPAPYGTYGAGGYGGYGAGGGGSYGSDDNVGTADLVTSVEAVFGSGYAPPPAGAYSVDSYSSGTTYGGSYGTEGYGYGAPSAPSVGTYGSYGYGSDSFPNAQPATGAIRPSDSSQLPDMVGGLGSYSTSAGLASGEGVGMGVGEVETDVYERPIINEILP